MKRIFQKEKQLLHESTGFGADSKLPGRHIAPSERCPTPPEQSPPPPERSSTLPERVPTPLEGSAPGSNSLAYEPSQYDGANMRKEAALVMIVGILSPNLGFCWWLMLISLLVTYYYAVFVTSSFQPPRCDVFSREMAKFAARTMLYLWILAGMIYWCFSITPFHIFVPTAMDVLTPYRVHEALHMTEVLHDPGRSASVDIFAIHGLGSMPENAWTYRSNETKVRWLSDLLPSTVGFQDARIVMVNHQTRWDSNAAYMEFNYHASELLEHIERQHKANPDRPIIFIAHSFGGLLLKKALLLAKSRSKHVAAMTRGIIFLGVPHRGTYAAFIASCLSCTAFFRGSSSSLQEFMSVDGSAILDLESEFYDGYVLPYHPYQPQPYICDVLEMRPERMGKFVLGPITRPKHGLLRHGRILALDTDHRGLNKFHSHSDPNFRSFLRTLYQAKTFALQPKPHVFDPVRPSNEMSTKPTTPDPPNPRNEMPTEPTPPDPPNPQNEMLTNPAAQSAPDPPDPQNEVSTDLLDFVDFLSSGIPWTINSRIQAFAFGGVQELVSSWLAKDRNKYGSYFTSRVLRMAIYEGLIGVTIGQALCWLVLKAFRGSTSFTAQMLQIVISSVVIVPLQKALSQVAMALSSGARTYHQVRVTVRVGAMPIMKSTLALYSYCIAVAYNLPPHAWTVPFDIAFVFVDIYTNTGTKKKRLALLRKRFFGSGRPQPMAPPSPPPTEHPDDHPPIGPNPPY
ncbi:hypothetical protein F4861DRAFT_536768 [Xylaria intraflava]|nr:hypothetical protein F4861DRAFT_536768 [Xylaria intraflava]